MNKITYINEVEIKNKTVLLRLDLNVSLNPNHTIADDLRIKQSLPTIKFLLENNNRLIIISHLGRPKGIEEKYSLSVVTDRLKNYLPDNKITLVKQISEVKNKNEDIIILENIRFFSKEKDYSTIFAKELSALADIYVNDAFGVCHRSDTSIIGPPKFLPSYGGLLLKNELERITGAITNPSKPFVTIVGGAKVSTKIGVLEKLIKVSDYILIGGGLANTFLCAQGVKIGTSFCEYEAVQTARKLLALSKKNRAVIELPTDAVVADKDFKNIETVKINKINQDKSIFDIGPETITKFSRLISQAKTIIWNGPVGYIENPDFQKGTDYIYSSIVENQNAVSIIGGGDTLTAISSKKNLEKITHISTGGGAMLEYIEKGTLPGIEALMK